MRVSQSLCTYFYPLIYVYSYQCTNLYPKADSTWCILSTQIMRRGLNLINIITVYCSLSNSKHFSLLGQKVWQQPRHLNTQKICPCWLYIFAISVCIMYCAKILLCAEPLHSEKHQYVCQLVIDFILFPGNNHIHNK